MSNDLHLVLLSVHGLVRATDPELGRDADTGGQVQYVIELARALAQEPQVARVSVITRLVDDEAVPPDYRQPLEAISDKAQIVRLPFGPRRYVRKELLWPHLDELVDRCIAWMRTQGLTHGRLPDVLHSHYADAGYVARELSLLLGLPHVHTAHSLGREKRARLLAAGRKEAAIDKQFNFERRIRVEESVLEHASLVVTSTRQEINQPYALYQNFSPRRAKVIPPGVNLERFKPQNGTLPWWDSAQNDMAQQLLGRFLFHPKKPMVLALCRPDTRKNIGALVAAFGNSPELKDQANLVIIAGTRDDIRAADEDAQQFFIELMLGIDRYDLYGCVAIPKQHTPEQIPHLYRLAARTRGVLVSPGLNENFGLTLLEAAASGLPVIATTQGGPQEIVANCRNGLLVQPQDIESITLALHTVLGDRTRWRRWSRNGIIGVARHYSWQAHAQSYLKHIERVLYQARKQSRWPALSAPTASSTGANTGTNISANNSVTTGTGAARSDTTQPLVKAAHLLVTDLDNTLIGNDEALARMLDWLTSHTDRVAFGVATGRTLQSTLALLREHKVPLPQVLVTSVGSDICYGALLQRDTRWQQHIRHAWRRDDLLQVLGSHKGLRLQPAAHQSECKISYYLDDARAPSMRSLQQLLRQYGLRANLVASHERYLDVLPMRASKGRAIRYLAYRWGFDLNQVLVAGDSGNDWDMLVGDTLAVVVGGHGPELTALQGREQVFFAPAAHAQGILQGVEHYSFPNQ
jgi:sucrose-phosphate synthase